MVEKKEIKIERERMESLRRYEILDTPPDGSFDNITKIASILFNMPIAIVSLVDEDRIWFKSKYGLEAKQIGRDPGLCASAMFSDGVYVVENAKKDPRTLANPLVCGDMHLRFYAAAPLKTKDGHSLGTLCIIDRKQRYINKNQEKILAYLAEIVMDEMELRLKTLQLTTEYKEKIKSLQKENKDLKKNKK